MPRSLVPFALHTRSAPVPDESPKLRPNISAVNEFQSSVLSEVTSEDVIMTIPEDLDAENIRGAVNMGNINAIVEKK